MKHSRQGIHIWISKWKPKSSTLIEKDHWKKCRRRETYSDGGRQQPASMGVSFADLYCLRVCTTQTTTYRSIHFLDLYFILIPYYHVTLYFLDKLLQSSDFTRQLFNRCQLCVLLSWKYKIKRIRICKFV